MLTTRADNDAPGKSTPGHETRRPRLAQRRHDRGSARSKTAAKTRNGAPTDAPERASRGARRLRIHRGDDVQDSKAATEANGKTASSRSRGALTAAARRDPDPDGQLNLTLDLSEPEPRGYRASAKPPRERVNTTRWLWWAMVMGAATCPILLGFQLVFTDPSHSTNVLAVVVTMAFGALFATWPFEYWLRRGTAAKPARPPTWALTRHAILASVGVAAMAVSALNRTASFGLLLLVIFTLIVADILLRRVRIR